jgi:hypothetical protein
MLSNKEIREKVFKVFNDYGYTVENTKVGNGYYLFDLGEESVVHFHIKGCKRWLFGLWIFDSTIYLFGEHEDHIDKFKPTQTVLSEKIEGPELESKIEDLVWSIIYNKIQVIHSSNLAGKIKFYYHGYEGLLKWLLSQWWFYRIEYPFKNWLKYYGNKYVCIIICFILNLVYHKRLSATYEKTEFYYPTYELYLNYKENTNDDDIYKVYCYINGDVGFNKSIRIEHIPYGEKREIYFKV